MTTTVNIREAKTHLSRLLEQVAAGERVVISKAGTPIADLVPHQAVGVTFGGLKGEVASPASRSRLGLSPNRPRRHFDQHRDGVDWPGRARGGFELTVATGPQSGQAAEE